MQGTVSLILFLFTELSYARQSLNTIKDLLFDRNLESVEDSVDMLDSRIDDLLQYLNRAMNHEREVIMFDDMIFAFVNTVVLIGK